jgi:hypothetical protein
VSTLKDLLVGAWRKRARGVVDESPRGDPSPPAPRRASVPAEYRPLYKYLDGRYAEALVLTFAEVEALVGFALPERARVDPDWWTNADATIAVTPQSRSWIEAGRTAKANLPAEIVLFERR